MKIKDAEWEVRIYKTSFMPNYFYTEAICFEYELVGLRGFLLNQAISKQKAFSAWKRFAKENGIKKWRLI